MQKEALILGKRLVFCPAFGNSGKFIPDVLKAKGGIKMTTFTHTVKDAIGIHAKPAGDLVSEAKKYKSYITISNGKHTANAKGLFNVTGLGVNCGDTVTVTINGSDEALATENLRIYFKNNL